MNNRMIVIGERLKQAREALGYTQQQIAEELNIGRPRYSDIENGKREVTLNDLERFCVFFGRPLEYFLKEKLAVESGFKVLFRKTGGDREVARVITEFEGLCERMHELEEITETRILSSISKDYNYEKYRVWFWGKHYAEQERKTLDLGQAPIKNLDRILEEKCGLKIFHLPIPEERGIFGMFTYDEKIGGCILINSNPSIGNQVFSIAHEYAHFIFHKDRLGIISYNEERNTPDERLANHFASNFLMPENELSNIFNTRIKKRKDISAEDIIHFADYFGVSFQAMVYRLNNLRLLSDDKKERLTKETWVTAVRESMGISESERGRLKFSSLYLHLCIKGYQQGRITTSKFAYFLELPLYQAMELGRKIKRSFQDEQSNSL